MPLPVLLTVVLQGRPDLEEWDAKNGSPTFGMIVGRAGDVNADGVPDFVVGDAGIGGTRNPPLFWMLSGKDGSTIRRFSIEPTSSESKALGYAHIQMDGGIDIDRDGTPDFLVAAQRYDAKLGSVTLISGRTGATLRKIPAPGSVGESGSWARFTSDRDGDGTPDLGLLTFGPAGGGVELSVYSGRSFESLWTCRIATDSSSNAGGFVETSDLDGDGSNDYAVTLGCDGKHPATVCTYSGRTGKRVWIHTPGSGVHGFCHLTLVELGDMDGDRVPDLAAGIDDGVEILSGKTGDLLVRFDGENRGEADFGFGASLAPMGDVNHDGWPELAIGETSWGLTEGCIHLKSGFDGSELWTAKRGMNPHEIDDAHHLGYQAAALGDVDGDSICDLVVGSCESLSGEPGLARVISGINGSVLFELRRNGVELRVIRPEPKSGRPK